MVTRHQSIDVPEYRCPVSADPYSGKRTERFRIPPKKRTAPSTLTTDEIPDKLSKIDETSLMTSQDIENVNILSENTEMKNETDSNTCTVNTDRKKQSFTRLWC